VRVCVMEGVSVAVSSAVGVYVSVSAAIKNGAARTNKNIAAVFFTLPSLIDIQNLPGSVLPFKLQLYTYFA
jgi:hypothetical protein